MINNENVISVETKQELVSRLLNTVPFSSDIELQRLLAMYPSQLGSRRSQTICDILNKILPQPQNLEAYAKFDLLLGFNKTRGHFVHQFEVFLLGLNILNLKWPGFIDLAQTSSKIDSQPKMLETWALTAAAHDIGYPMSAAIQVAGAIGDMYSDINLMEIAEKFKEMDPFIKIDGDANFYTMSHGSFSMNVMDFIEKSLNRYISSEDTPSILVALKERKNHGFLSAVLITKLLFNHYVNKFGVSKFQDQWEWESLELAVGAIALHAIDFTNRDKELMLKAESKKNIFAYLLFIVDNIQDWDRNIFEGHKYPEYFLRNFMIDSSEINIEYYITHEKWDESFQKEASSFVTCKEKMRSVFSPPGLNLGVNVVFKSEDASINKRMTITI